MFSFLFCFVFIISINFDMDDITLHVASKIRCFIRTQEEKKYVESLCVEGDKIVITVRSEETKVSCRKREMSSSLEDTTGDPKENDG